MAANGCTKRGPAESPWVPEDVGLLFAARVEPVPVMAAAGGLGKRGEGRGAAANKMAAAGRGAAANKMAAAGEEGPAAWRRAAGRGWGS
jgi:hypothetical protein